MAQQAATAKPPAAPIDERVARVGVVSHIFRRPEIGSLVGVVAVFALFTITAHGFAGLDGLARWSDEASNIGIMAVPVALLMIGGEFDLSAGVMSGSAGLLFAYLVTHGGWNVWPALVIVLLFGMTVGLLNGALVTKTGLPSFIVTLGTFFSLEGLNLGLNPQVGYTAFQAAQSVKSTAKVATFDLSTDVLKSIQNGGMLFAIDQQQYLQGYLPIVFLYLNNTNANTVGGGKPILTGPGFVDKTNASKVIALAGKGTR